MRPRAKFNLFSWVLLASLSFSGVSWGDTTGLSGFDLRLFRPPSDGSGLLNLHGSRPLGRWQFAVGSVSDSSQGMLEVTNPFGDSVQVVDEYFNNIFIAAVGLTPFFQVGLSLPTIYFEQGEHFVTGEDFTTASIGDIGLEMKLTLLKDGAASPDSPDTAESRLWPGLALVSITTFPSGSTEKFTGSSNVTEEVKLVIDKKIGPVYLVANGGYRVLERTQVVGLDMDDSITYGGGFSWSLPFGALDLLAEADGTVVIGNPQERTSPLEWVAGLRQRIVEGLNLDIAGGGGIGSGVGGGDFRIVAGFHFYSVPEKKPEETQPTEEAPAPETQKSRVKRKT